MGGNSKTIVWFRRDLRIENNPALAAAAKDGSVLPVYIWCPKEEGHFYPGRVSRWWLKQSLTHLDHSLRSLGAALVLIKSESTLTALVECIKAIGATKVVFNHLYGMLCFLLLNATFSPNIVFHLLCGSMTHIQLSVACVKLFWCSCDILLSWSEHKKNISVAFNWPFFWNIITCKTWILKRESSKWKVWKENTSKASSWANTDSWEGYLTEKLRLLDRRKPVELENASNVNCPRWLKRELGRQDFWLSEHETIFLVVCVTVVWWSSYDHAHPQIQEPCIWHHGPWITKNKRGILIRCDGAVDM